MLDEDGNRITGGEEVLHDDDTPHDDDAGYDQALVLAQSVSLVPLRSTSISVGILAGAGGVIEAGMFFSIRHPTWHWRLYVIRTAVLDAAKGWYDLTIRPELREAVPGSTPIEFDTPRCLMRLATPDALRLTMERRKFASPSWAFVETGRPEA